MLQGHITDLDGMAPAMGRMSQLGRLPCSDTATLEHDASPEIWIFVSSYTCGTDARFILQGFLRHGTIEICSCEDVRKGLVDALFRKVHNPITFIVGDAHQDRLSHTKLEIDMYEDR
jgi:hypothetical protein